MAEGWLGEERWCGRGPSLRIGKDGVERIGVEEARLGTWLAGGTFDRGAAKDLVSLGMNLDRGWTMGPGT